MVHPKKHLAAFFLLLFLLAQGTFLAWNTGQTADEPYSMAVGWPVLHRADYRFLGEHPPLVYVLGTLPLALVHFEYPYDAPVRGPNGAIEQNLTGSRFLYEMGNDPRRLLFASRMAVVLLMVFLGVILYAWAWELYGSAGALISLALYTLCPNILAHGSLYTTDMGITALFFSTLYFLHRFFSYPGFKRAALAGVCCGLALISKINAMILVPLVFLIFVLAVFLKSPAVCSPAPEPTGKNRGGIAGILVLFGMLFTHKTPAVLWGPLCLMVILYDGIGSWQSGNRLKKTGWWILQLAGWGILGGIALASKKHGALYQQGLLAWVLAMMGLSGWIVVQKDKSAWVRALRFLGGFWMAALAVVILGYFDYVPRLTHGRFFQHFLKSLHMVFTHSQGWHVFCLGGSFIPCDKRYFLASMLVKTPAALLVLASLGLGLVACSRSRPILTRILILIPPLAYLLAASCFSQIRIGLRHVLPVYPFLFLMAGSVPHFIRTKMVGTARRLAWGGMLSLMGLSAVYTLRYFPDYIPYFNEFVGSTEEGAKLTEDSSLTWGQDHRRLTEIVRERNIDPVAVLLSKKNDAEFLYYGLKWRQMKEEELLQPRPGWYAVDVADVQRLQKVPSSLFFRRRPDAVAGRTVYLFQVKETDLKLPEVSQSQGMS